MADTELLELHALEINGLIRSGQFSCEELVSTLIARADQCRSLNAYITLDDLGALRRAREIDRRISAGDDNGMLLGVPLVLKDNIEVVGLPNTAGTPSLEKFIPEHNAPVAQALIDQGAVILGKTNMHELAFGVTSNNRHFGAVGNPHHGEYFAGGSSGGTGAAVSARMAVAGLGTDTGGSVRIPAALTGIAGFRPGMRRYSQVGITPISSTRDTAGPMARCISDLILLDAVITQTIPDYTPASPNTIRLGVPRKYFFEGLDPDVEDRVSGILKEIERGGICLVDAEVEGMDDFERATGFSLALFEAKQGLYAYLQARSGGRITLDKLAATIASPDVQNIFSAYIFGDQAPTHGEYTRALEVELPAIRSIYRSYFDDKRVDGMIIPTVPVTARPLAGCDDSILLNGVSVPTFPTVARNTSPGSIAGIPGVTIPAGLSSDGLPIGIEIDAPWDTDTRLLSIALTLEEIIGTIPPPPLVSS